MSYYGKKSESIVKQFRARELGVKSHYNFNTKTLKAIVIEDCRHYELIWETHSKHPIYYENQKIFLDNYRICYHINGLNKKPCKLFKLAPVSVKQKIEDGLLSEFSIVEVQEPKKAYLQCFFALTANGWLLQYETRTGKLKEEIFLNKNHHFKYISWNEVAHSIVIKSIISRPCPEARRAGIHHSHFVTFCLFSVFPLEFIGLLEIHRNIFGKDIIDAIIAESLLCVSHQSGNVKIYSIQEIMQQGRCFKGYLGKHSAEFDGIVGGFPDGLPLNIKLTASPSVMFEVKCADNDLKMGGFPWHYIITPFKSRNTFQVYSMANHKLAENGTLKNDALSIYPDKATFHPDDSGRIILFTSSELRVFYLKTSSIITSVCESFKINLPKNTESKLLNPTFQTASGRTVRRRQIDPNMTSSAFHQTLVTFNYENELDILAVLGVDHETTDTDSNPLVANYVHLHNNTNGVLMKNINLKKLPFEHLENQIVFDLDVLVNIRKEIDGKFACYVYRMAGEHQLQV